MDVLEVGVIYEANVQDDEAPEKLEPLLVADVVECLVNTWPDDELCEDVHTLLEADDDELDEYDIVMVGY